MVEEIIPNQEVSGLQIREDRWNLMILQIFMNLFEGDSEERAS
jgi:hypothetical protein